MTTLQSDTTLDGLCLIGTLESVEPVIRVRGPQAGTPVEGLAKAIIDTSRGKERLDLSQAERSITGNIALPAFDKLMDYSAKGQRFLITVGIRNTIDANGVPRANLVALNAEAI